MSAALPRAATLARCLNHWVVFVGVLVGLCSTVHAQVPGHDEREDGLRPLVLKIDAANPAANVSAPTDVRRAFAETFESGVFPPAGWTRFETGDGGGTQQWALTDASGNNVAYSRFSDAGSGVVEDWLVTPLLSVTAADATLSFDMAQEFASAEGSTYSVAVSTTSADRPDEFVEIASWSESSGPNAQPAPPVFSNGFTTYTLDLSAYQGQEVYVAFVHVNENGDSFLLDNVAGPSAYVPTAPPACAMGLAPTQSNVAPGTATLTWDSPTEGEPPAGYLLDIGTDSGASNIATQFDVGNATALEVQNIAPSETFFYRVTPYNGAGTATGCAIVSFSTAPPLTAYPYAEGFETGTTCSLPEGWSYEANPVSGERWRFVRSMPFGAEADHTSESGCFAAVNDAPANDAPTSLLSPFFDFSDLQDPVLSFWVQNRRRGQPSPRSYSSMFVDASTDGGSNYVQNVASVVGKFGRWTKVDVDLSAFADEPSVRLRFRGVEADRSTQTTRLSDFSLDDVFVGGSPGEAVFAITPGSNGTYDFGTAAPCAEREALFTITNDGARRSDLMVNSASISGDPAFSIVGTTPALPVSLREDETADLLVRFDPDAGVSHTATLTVNYATDSGLPQTYDLVLSGSGGALSASSGQGAGYVWQNSTPCASSAVTFEDIAFGSSAGDTQVTVWDAGTANDGYAAIDLTPTIGSFRFYGEEYGTAYINTNGYIFFDFGTGSPGPPFPATTEFENAYIAALGDDLDLTSSGAVFYRGRDTDADGTDDELVVTYLRVPRFNVPSDFATFQVILRPSDTPGGNGTIKLQYLVGVSPTDGQPLSQGVDNANSFNADARVGITGDQGFGSVLYRDNGTGGVLFGGNSLAIEFAPRTERIEGADAATAGWRMLAAPTAGMTVADLAEQNLVQGIADEYPVDAQGNTTFPNIYTGFSSASGFQRPSGLGGDLTPGKGFIWYFFNIDFDPEVDANIPTGDSQSYPLPTPIVASGNVHMNDVTASFTSASGSDGIALELLGNPYAAPLDVSDIASWTDGTLASAVGQVWEPATGTYITTSDLGDVLPVWQGALFENDTATEITFPRAAIQAARTTPGHPSMRGDGTLNGTPQRVRFELSGRAVGSGAPTQDRALVVEFSNGGTDGWDVRDATKLSPLTNVFATAAFEGERNGVSRLKAQESRSVAPAPFDVPIRVEASGVEDELTFGWTLDAFPADWQFALYDQEAGQQIDLRRESDYTFMLDGNRRAPEQTANDVSADLSRDALTRFAQPAPMQRGSEARFVLRVVPGVATAGEAQSTLPEQLSLAGVYPNPFAGRTTVRYALPSDARVRLAVYDLLGRRVATLADGVARAGYHEASWDAAGLPSGVYIVRLEDEHRRVFQKVTLMR